MLTGYKKKILIKFAFSYPKKKNSTDVWTLTLFIVESQPRYKKKLEKHTQKG